MKHTNGDTTVKHKSSDGTVSIRKDKSGKVIEALVKQNGKAGIHAFVDTPQGLRIYSHENYLIHHNKEVSTFRYADSKLNQGKSNIIIRHSTLLPVKPDNSLITVFDPHERNRIDTNELLKISDHPDFKKLIKQYQ